MEIFSLFPVTMASILSGFPGASATPEEAVISTYTTPEIAGLWELDLTVMAQELNLDEQQPLVEPDTLSQPEVASTKSTGLKPLSPLSTITALTPSKAKLPQTDNQNIQLDAGLLAVMQADLKDQNGLEVALTGNRETITAHNKNSCRERYNFGANNKIVTTSGAEWTVGEYLYQYPADGLPLLAISTIYDNNEADCLGQQVDQTGDALIAFVDYQADSNTMRWCADKAGKQCFMTFNRLLP